MYCVSTLVMRESGATRRESESESGATSVNLKKAGLASRNIVIKNNARCFKSAFQ